MPPRFGLASLDNVEAEASTYSLLKSKIHIKYLPSGESVIRPIILGDATHRLYILHFDLYF